MDEGKVIQYPTGCTAFVLKKRITDQDKLQFVRIRNYFAPRPDHLEGLEYVLSHINPDYSRLERVRDLSEDLVPLVQEHVPGVDLNEVLLGLCHEDMLSTWNTHWYLPEIHHYDRQETRKARYGQWLGEKLNYLLTLPDELYTQFRSLVPRDLRWVELLLNKPPVIEPEQPRPKGKILKFPGS